MIVPCGTTETPRSGVVSFRSDDREDPPMTEQQKLRDDLERIEARAHALDPLRTHWQGRPATAFMSPKSREALEGRMDRLAINFPRLLACSYVYRLNSAGLSA